jgi:phosphorylcholine metabolism protein LicD
MIYMNSYNRKFFKEMKNKPHLDSRYGKYNLSKNSIHAQLKMLLAETVDIFNKIDIPCIIMHGSLIGWYFGQKMLPWDDDIDIVILEEHREKLKTLHGYQNNKVLIEINPVIDTIQRDPSNIIEARIICKNTGVFIDVTNLSKGNIFHIGASNRNVITKTFPLNEQYTDTDSFLFKPISYNHSDHFDIRYNLISRNKIQITVKRRDMNQGWGLDLHLYGYDSTMFPLYNKNEINCFSPHYYPIIDIYPLKQTTFENINVYIPNNVENTLISEYGNKVLKPYYRNYIYKDGVWKNKV